MEDSDVPPLNLPEEEAPLPSSLSRPTANSASVPALTLRRRSSHRLSVSHRRSSSLGLSFEEVLLQIQGLQERLLHIYETDSRQKSKSATAESARKNGSPPASRAHSQQSPRESVPLGVQLQPELEPEELPMTQRKSNMSTASRRLATHMAQAAVQRATSDLCEDAAFRIGIEWDLRDDQLVDLQTNHAITSPKTQTVTTSQRRMRMSSMTLDPGCAVSPESSSRVLWDCIAMVVLLFEVLTVPLQVYNLAPDTKEVLDLLHWVTTGYWLLDVPASFLTAVYINDVLHTQLKDVARVYLKSWFCFDMLMLAPELFIIFTLSNSSELEVSGVLRTLRARRLVRLVRFVKVLRFRKSMNLIKQMSCYRQFRLFFHGWISSTLTPVLSLVLCLMIAVHFLAGLWFLAGDVDTGWVCLEGLHEASFARQYLRSVEWALSRLPASSLKGNVELNTAFERWLAIIATGIALIISSLFVSVLTNLMANAARRTRKMTQILESVRKYCGACGVSAGHTRKIKHLVERDHLRASIQNHMEFLLALPEGLVVELFHEARAKTLAFHPFFSEIGSANLVMESHLCNKAVKELYLLERDLMFYANQKGQGIYIIAAGAAGYISGADGSDSQLRGEDEALPSSMFFNVLTNHGHRKSNESAGQLKALQDANHPVGISSGEYVSEQSLWIRGWKHHGRLEATVESRALHLPTREVYLVLQDHADALVKRTAFGAKQERYAFFPIPRLNSFNFRLPLDGRP
ncbi:unnamed protein product [Durusdinium trenchii]|uniref:Ion transport domain-containing protein n=1 Tax=Durusdinium trenchii TaxID=1381693 RepID=A0ABP0PFA3_9DINO